MGAAPSKVNVAGDVEVENPVDKSVFRPTPSEKHVEDPSVIPTPSAKREDYEDIIESLQRDLHATHERAEVALNELSVQDAEIDKLRQEKDDATRHFNTASKAARLSRERSLALQTEVEKLRAERVNNTRQLYESGKTPEVAENEPSRPETTLNDAPRAGVMPISEHEAILKASDHKIEVLEVLCNELRKMAGQSEPQKGTVQFAVDQATQDKETDSVSDIVKKLVNDHTMRCTECKEVLALYLKLLKMKNAIMEEYRDFRQTMTETTTPNKKTADLIDQQAETIRRIENNPKPYWVFEERRFWEHSEWKLRPVKLDGCGGS